VGTLTLILLIAAAVVFALAAFGVAATRVNLIALGLLLLTLVPLLDHLAVLR
jgi:hypothetical protein